MKMFVWLVIVLLLVITFSDTALIRPYKEQVVEFVTDNVAEFGDSREAALRKTRKQLLEKAQQWGDSQREQLEKATSSIESLKRFRQNYCINKDFSPYLYGEPLQQSCAIIEQNYHNLTQQ
ncbi:MAG: hypothetical protein R3241_05525 [Rheinheimera sp.]|jgi:cell shape-determining protein MreC|nr:hypothetical protein [Rheinheimera sp.]